MTRMPASSPLIRNRVCSTPVVAPASAPAANDAAVAAAGDRPATISTAVTAPPSVSDPSVVMSGKLKIRKLTKTPKASSDRISPMVNAPINSSMRFAPMTLQRPPASGPIQQAPRMNVLSPAPAAPRSSCNRWSTPSSRWSSKSDATVGAEIEIALLHSVKPECGGVQMSGRPAADRPQLRVIRARLRESRRRRRARRSARRPAPP